MPTNKTHNKNNLNILLTESLKNFNGNEDQLIKYISNLVEKGADISAIDENGTTLLMIAAELGLIKISKYLINHGIGVNIIDNNGKSALSYAGYNEQEEIVKAILEEESFDIAAVDSDGVTVLMVAIELGLTQDAKNLIDKGVDLNLRDANQQTALIYAAYSGCRKTFEEILDKGGIDLDVQDHDGRTPAIHAAQNGNIEIVNALIKAGADLNIKDKSGYSPLLLAAHYGYTEIVQALWAEKGKVDIDIVDIDEVTPLMHAIYNDKIEAAQFLISNISNINAVNKLGQTALMMAAQEGRKEIIEILVKRKDVDIDLADNQGMTPLMNSVYNNHIEITRLLISKIKNINAASEDGITALIIAIQEGNQEITKMLLEKEGIDIDAAAKDGTTPLMNAIYKSDIEISRLLVGKTKKTNAFNNRGQTALMIAVQKGRREMVKILLEEDDIDIEAVDKDGNTQLMNAISNKHIETVRFFIRKSSNLEITNNAGLTASMIADQEGIREIAEYISNFSKIPPAFINAGIDNADYNDLEKEKPKDDFEKLISDFKTELEKEEKMNDPKTIVELSNNSIVICCESLSNISEEAVKIRRNR